jgi:acyl phosphate:glycerol-3-phosphate acyltransferase
MTRELMLPLAYLLGSIPSAYIAVKLAGKGDVREIGSGNVGATNTLRAAGWKVAVPVMLVDIGKGVAAVLLMRQVTPNPDWVVAAGLAAIVGHCFPIWLGFSGGKGVATAAGVFCVLAWPAALVAAGVWIAMVVATRIVSVASIAAATAFPIAFYFLQKPSLTVMICAVAAAAVIIFRHRGNFGRLVRGEERRLGGQK